MKKFFKIFFILFITFQSCDNNGDCEDYACFTPPSPFMFELVDKSTGENLFTNGTFQSGDIEIMTLESDEEVDFTFIDENDLDIIQIGSIGWDTKITQILISVDSEDIFELYVDAERVSEDCCAFTRYNEIRIDNAEFEVDENNGVYRVFVE